MKKPKMINFGKLKERCLSPIHKFRREGTTILENTVREHIFVDRGSSVLAVAHLDTVNNLDHFYSLRIGGELCVMVGQLDDRLGAHVILDVLPKFNILPDVLLTIGEETGASSGEFFEPPRQYNWMFSFDRHGTDVVTYQYKDEQVITGLKMAGFDIGIGSFSDISCMGHLKCAGINFGVGYRDEHFATAHVFVGDTVAMVNKFCPFYFQHKDTRFPHDPKEVRQFEYGQWWGVQKYYRGSGYTTFQADDDNESVESLYIPSARSNGRMVSDSDNSIPLSYEEIGVLATLYALEEVGFPLEVIPTGTEYSSITIALLAEMLDSRSVEWVIQVSGSCEDELYDMDAQDVLDTKYKETALWMLDNIHFPPTVSRLGDFVAGSY